MNVRALDISPSSSLLCSLFFSRALSFCFHFPVEILIISINVFMDLNISEKDILCDDVTGHSHEDIAIIIGDNINGFK